MKSLTRSALAEAVHQVAFVAMGGGFSWGAALIRWPHLEGSGI